MVKKPNQNQTNKQTNKQTKQNKKSKKKKKQKTKNKKKTLITASGHKTSFGKRRYNYYKIKNNIWFIMLEMKVFFVESKDLLIYGKDFIQLRKYMMYIVHRSIVCVLDISAL